MNHQNKKRVVILEENQVNRDILKAAVEATGHLAFVFDRETTFFNNFIPLNADLIIFQAATINKVSRIINTVQLLEYQKPIIIISEISSIAAFIASTPGVRVKVFTPAYQRWELKNSIKSLLNETDHPNDRNILPVIVGNTPDIIRMRKMVVGLKNNNDPILIQGEKGTGKKLLGKSIHAASFNNDNTFIKANLSRQLFNTNIENYEKHPFEIKKIIPSISKTLNEAHGGGTLYFEGIDRIPISFQGILLQCFDGELSDNIRIIASSNAKIDRLVDKGNFRKDLYFRLNVIKINVPPLRERKADIPLLTDFFINKICIQSGICHFKISDRMKRALTEYFWPQNVEELEGFLSSENLIGNEEQLINKLYKLAAENRRYSQSGFYSGSKLEKMNQWPEKLSLKEISRQFSGRIESEILKMVLEKTNWNRKRAAETLSISYKSLLNKIKAYNLN